MITHKAKASLAAALLTLAALPAQAQDWTGAYVGASASSHSGMTTDYNNGVGTGAFERSGTMRGIFGGYRIQSGDFVYGAELSRSTGKLPLTVYPVNYTSEYNTGIASIGYSVDNLLLSAGIGYFNGTVIGNDITFPEANISGTVLRLGFDALVTEKVTVGAAVSRRTFGKARYADGTYEVAGDDTAVELRVGYNF